MIAETFPCGAVWFVYPYVVRRIFRTYRYLSG